MSTLYVPADLWDSLTPEEQQTARDEANTPVSFGIPAVWYGDFDAEGAFVRIDVAEDGTPPDAPRWYVQDDHRFTEQHAIALATALEGL